MLIDFFKGYYFDFILFVVASFGLFIVYQLKKMKRFSFPTLLIISLSLALVFGLAILMIAKVVYPMTSSFASYSEFHKAMIDNSFSVEGLNFLKSLFTTLMRMMIVPLVLFSILNVVITQTIKSKKSLYLIIGGFILTVLLGALVAVIMSLVLNLGSGMSISITPEDIERYQKYIQAVDNYSVFSLIQSFIPVNIIDTMANNNVIGIMIFAALLGISIKRAKKRYSDEVDVVMKFTNGIYQALTYMTRTILQILPYSIFAMILVVILGRDFSSIAQLGLYMVAVLGSIVIVFIIHLFIISLQGLSPIKYIKNVLPALVVAFSSSSSNATLPVTMTSLKDRAGVSKGNATLIPTLATSMGMTACAGIYPAILAMLTLNATGQSITISVIFMTLLYCVLASFGTQGIPGTATIAATFVLTSLGLPLGGLVLVAPIDFFVDMFRTTLNVNGAMVVTITADRALNELDKTVFNADN